MRSWGPQPARSGRSERGREARTKRRWTNAGGEKFPRPIKAFTKAWAAACLNAGYPGRIPHDLRRSGIRNMVRAGISETVAMKLSGHKTRDVFDRYDIVSDRDLGDAAVKLDALTANQSANRWGHAGAVSGGPRRRNH